MYVIENYPRQIGLKLQKMKSDNEKLLKKIGF